MRPSSCSTASSSSLSAFSCPTFSPASTATAWGGSPLWVGFSAPLIALRLAWMFPGARLAYFVRTRFLHQHYEIPLAKQFLSWGGRVWAVWWPWRRPAHFPTPSHSGGAFPQRNMIIFLTFSVILVTLVLQGSRCHPLVRLLGFNSGGPDSRKRKPAQCLCVPPWTFWKMADPGKAQCPSRVRRSHPLYEHQLNELEEANIPRRIRAGKRATC